MWWGQKSVAVFCLLVSLGKKTLCGELSRQSRPRWWGKCNKKQIRLNSFLLSSHLKQWFSTLEARRPTKDECEHFGGPQYSLWTVLCLFYTLMSVENNFIGCFLMLLLLIRVDLLILNKPIKNWQPIKKSSKWATGWEPLIYSTLYFFIYLCAFAVPRNTKILQTNK